MALQPFLMLFRRLSWCLAVLLLGGAAVQAQPVQVVLFDEAESGEADYYGASAGAAEGGDVLVLAGPDGTRMPLATGGAFSGEAYGVLSYRHVAGGSWSLTLGTGEPVDLAGFDTLVVHLGGPAALSGAELPRLALEDAGGGQTAFRWLSAPENVRVDAARTGFTDESPTNARLAVRYVNVLPANARRPGYPEDFVVTFAAEPVDTSVAAIGAPAVPARFRVETASGARLDFNFRDVDGDGTLSAAGEYIVVLLPEEEGGRARPAWRLEPNGTVGSDPLRPPGAGDVYEVALAYDAFTLDADPATWQRLSIPLADLAEGSAFDAAQFAGLVFAHGGINPEERTLWVDRVAAIRNDDEAFLDMVQRVTFDFFWKEANPSNGLIRDRSRPGSASSIASVGFGLSAIAVAVDRGWITREQGAARVRTTLRFFWNAPQSTAVDATGYKGFFYHFLNMQTGRRSGTTELSTIDTALLIAGVLHMRVFFDADDPVEEEIRTLSDAIYERVDWAWAQARPPAISHGWKPETGFLAHDWLGYNEAMILYILALGSPTHPVEPEAWDAWVSGYGSQWQTQYGYTFLTFPPLFGHQYSHVWIDFRGIQDAYMREKGIDYFENSRRATLAQRAYHIANPRGWPNYGRDEWGLTASDTPTGYRARGAPPAQNDDGTLVPTAPGGSIVFTPEESIAALRHMYDTYPRLWGPYGFRDAYNVSVNWFDEDYIGIDQGPILLMAENYRTESVWEDFMRHEAVQRGLVRAGFLGAGLDASPPPELPAALAVESVHPNPFDASAEIRYVLPEAGRVRLALYDVLGREVAVLVDAVQPAGAHAATVGAAGLASGVYLYRLRQGAAVRTGTLVRLR